jgi:fructokinase
VKLNAEELRDAASMLSLRGEDERALAEDLLARFDLNLVAVTRGERGSLLVSREGASEHAGFRVEVADTIGSGDAFAAALAHCRLRGASLEASNETANRVGSWVATRAGAQPDADAQTIARLLEGAPEGGIVLRTED